MSYLMHENLPVLEFDTKQNFTVLLNSKLPIYLRDRIGTGKYNDIDLFTTWAANRCISIGRKYAKEILNAYQLTQNQSNTCKAAISLSFSAVSLEDHYWVCMDPNVVIFEHVDLTKCPLQKAMIQIALTGKPSIVNRQLPNPELQTFGAYAKTWQREQDGIYLHKRSETNLDESGIEVWVSDLLDKFEVNHVKYERAFLFGVETCRCKLMTTKDYSRVTAADVNSWRYSTSGESVTQYAIKLDSKHFFEMCIIDYLIANRDRHLDNWGFFMNNHTGKLECLHPLFDHNNAFDPAFESDETESLVVPRKTLKDVAIYAYKRNPIVLPKVTKKDFPNKEAYEWFKHAANTILQ